MKEAKTEPLFEAWLGLSAGDRKAHEADLREIEDLCCEKGFNAILDELGWRLEAEPDVLAAITSRLAALPSHYERAMLTFLDHSDCRKGATRFYQADTLSYWRKRKNLPHVPAATDESSLETLARKIGDYFHYTEGRGKHCVVEPYRRGELDYYFCFPGDHSRRDGEWIEGQLDLRPHNPAFEIVFVYSQREGTLDLNFRGAKKAVEPLQVLFAQVILGLEELPPDPKDQRVYDLNLLRKKNFAFSFRLESGIRSMRIKKLRLSSYPNKGDQLTVEADSTENPNAVYELMTQISIGVPLHTYNVSQVEMVASVYVGSDQKPKSIPIRISYPNSCSLKYDEIDLKLRAMLKASGIEPKSAEDLTVWPEIFVAAIKSQGIIKPSSPAQSAICGGCKRECVMSVHLVSSAEAQTNAFVVCDKRSDINRVRVPMQHLERWQISGNLVADVLAGLLGTRRP